MKRNLWHLETLRPLQTRAVGVAMIDPSRCFTGTMVPIQLDLQAHALLEVSVYELRVVCERIENLETKIIDMEERIAGIALLRRTRALVGRPNDNMILYGEQ